ncbi:Holliday junction resolvase RuvX [bacterium]|nr:Holliday junction resolvase RuvX [bacterium]
MRFLGIDHGDAKIGLALGDSEVRVALPFKILKNEYFWTDIDDIIKREEIDEIILGLPKNLSNQNTQQTEKVLEFLKLLRKKINKPIHLEDERMTSIFAQNIKREMKSKMGDDASAAALILDSYLQRNYGK